MIVPKPALKGWSSPGSPPRIASLFFSCFLVFVFYLSQIGYGGELRLHHTGSMGQSRYTSILGRQSGGPSQSGYGCEHRSKGSKHASKPDRTRRNNPKQGKSIRIGIVELVPGRLLSFARKAGVVVRTIPACFLAAIGVRALPLS